MNMGWFRRLSTTKKIIGILTVVSILVVSVFNVIFNRSWPGATESIATLLLFSATLGLLLAAVIAGLYAKKHIEIIQLHNRNQLYLQLMDSLGGHEARVHRGILHKIREEMDAIKNEKPVEPIYTAGLERENLNNIAVIKKLIEAGRIPGIVEVYKQAKDAIEETIALLDRVGFFLLHGEDDRLPKDAPTSIWSISKGVYELVGDYVIDRQKKENIPHYGRYFIELAEKSYEML